jgi:hypothetical protein
MAVSRRRFLRHGTLAAVGCAAGPLLGWSRRPDLSGDAGPKTPKNPGGAHSSALTQEAFQAVVGSGFKVTHGPDTVWLRLMAVEDLPPIVPVNVAAMAVPPPKSASPTIATTGFTLSFLGTFATPLPQGTFDFEHDRFGKFQLFIVPGAEGSQSYTALFNQLGQAVFAPAAPAPAPGNSPGAGSLDRGGPGTVLSGGGSIGNDSGRPLQEQIEPSFGDRLKTKMPE